MRYFRFWSIDCSLRLYFESKANKFFTISREHRGSIDEWSALAHRNRLQCSKLRTGMATICWIHAIFHFTWSNPTLPDCLETALISIFIDFFFMLLRKKKSTNFFVLSSNKNHWTCEKKTLQFVSIPPTMDLILSTCELTSSTIGYHLLAIVAILCDWTFVQGTRSIRSRLKILS